MNTQKVYDLEERLIDFAVMAIGLTNQLPNTHIGKHLAGQLNRSGTSPALIYGEAQAAESIADFIHKMKIGLKELRESQINMKIIIKAKLVASTVVLPILDECNQLVAIFSKSVKTAEKRKEEKR